MPIYYVTEVRMIEAVMIVNAENAEDALMKTLQEDGAIHGKTIKDAVIGHRIYEAHSPREPILTTLD
jgi:hypothetical protein